MLRTRARGAFAVALVLAAAGPARAEWQAFRAAQGGLAGDRILAIAEHRDGAIAFSTEQGTSRFDGLRWTTYRDSLSSLAVYAHLQDFGRSYWFATERGLWRFDGTAWTRHDSTRTGDLPSDLVRAALEDRRGILWFGTPRGVARFDPGTRRWSVHDAGLAHPFVWRLLEDARGRLWYATPEGAGYLHPDGSPGAVYREHPAALGRDSVLALAEGPDGSIWFGTDRGAWRLAPDASWSSFGEHDGIPDTVLAIARDSTGRMWFGGREGLARYDGERVQRFRQTDSRVAFGEIRALHVDGPGNLWVATTAGALRYDGVAFRHYHHAGPGACSPPSTASGAPAFPVLGSNCLTASLRDVRGELWFGTYDGGLSRLARSGAWSRIGRDPFGLGVASDSVAALAEDGARRLWVASQVAGIAVLDSTRVEWTLHEAATGLPSDSVRCLTPDHAGGMWAGTRNGAGHWNGSRWRRWLQGADPVVEVLEVLVEPSGTAWLRTSSGLHSIVPDGTVRRWTTADGLAGDDVTAMLRDRDGALWFGSSTGLARSSGGAWTRWATVDGLAANVRALHEDRTGRIWVGLEGGAGVWNGASWTSFGPNVPAAPVTAWTEDATGALWAGSEVGAHRWNGERWKSYATSDGLASSRVSHGLVDGAGSLWFPSNRGLTEHEPDRVAPRTVITGGPPALTVLRTAVFAFGAAYGEVADLEFSYALRGQSFSPWSPEPSARFVDLGDGADTLAVRARDRWRNTDPVAATYAFEVDATAPSPRIDAPVAGLPVRGTVAIVGATTDSRFRRYVLEAKPASVADWSGAQTLAQGEEQVERDTLALWSTGAGDVAEGEWDLRLVVADTLGLIGVSTVRVVVDNQAPFAAVTSPARIVATEGGDVFTTNAEVHVYVPPRGFDADAVVAIDAEAPAPDTLPGGAVRRSAAWRVGWTGATLVRAGVLEMQPSVAGDAVAAWLEDDAGWRRLGGSVQPDGRVALPLEAPGRYALFSDPAPPGGGPLGALSVTPRAFSPRGRFASTSVAIGFALGRPGAATVKVYNRAGRLVRAVAEGAPSVAGWNVVRWDGRDRDGATVDEGLYLVTVEALGETRTTTLGVVR